MKKRLRHTLREGCFAATIVAGLILARICRRMVTRRILTDLRAEAMAGDIAGLMKNLGIPKAAIMGYSLGAGVALQLPRGGKKDGRDGSGISNARLTILPGLTHYNIFPRRHWYRRLRRSWTLPCRNVSDGL